MIIALSRTGVSPMRMQAAAQALLTAGCDDGTAMSQAASVCQLHRDSDQIANALRFICDIEQEVTVMTADLRQSIRIPLLAVDKRPNQIRLWLAASAATDWMATTDSLILSGRFLGRPLVCALNAAGAPYSGEFQIVTPAWMLLAEQRESYRVKLPASRLATPWGEIATILDITETGLAFTLPGPAPHSIQEGAGWSSLLLHGGLETAIPVYLSTVQGLPKGIAGMRVGARMNVTGSSAKRRLRNLIRCHTNLFTNEQLTA